MRELLPGVRIGEILTPTKRLRRLSRLICFFRVLSRRYQDSLAMAPAVAHPSLDGFLAMRWPDEFHTMDYPVFINPPALRKALGNLGPLNRRSFAALMKDASLRPLSREDSLFVVVNTYPVFLVWVKGTNLFFRWISWGRCKHELSPENCSLWFRRTGQHYLNLSEWPAGAQLARAALDLRQLYLLGMEMSPHPNVRLDAPYLASLYARQGYREGGFITWFQLGSGIYSCSPPIKNDSLRAIRWLREQPGAWSGKIHPFTVANVLYHRELSVLAPCNVNEMSLAFPEAVKVVFSPKYYPPGPTTGYMRLLEEQASLFRDTWEYRAFLSK